MTSNDVETILLEADNILNIVVCKSNDKNACELIPACDRFMKFNGFCECGVNASFIHSHKNLCRECFIKYKKV